MNRFKISDLRDNVGEIDLFITSISFEDRCKVVYDELLNCNLIRRKSWVAFNKNEQEFFEGNFAHFQSNDKVEFMEFSSDNPLVSYKSLIGKFIFNENIGNILVDISTFTHEGLLILFKYLEIFRDFYKGVRFIYLGVEEYSYKEQEGNKWLSKGTKTIRSVLGYPGVLNPAKKNHLIILFGFEYERTVKLIESFEFDKVSIGVGPEGSLNSKHYELNRKLHLDLINRYPFCEPFEFSLDDSIKCQQEIEKQINKYPNYNVVITPLNNKISTLGAGLVALQNPVVQLSYVRPHEYNINAYSKPSDDCYLFSLEYFDLIKKGS
ncbi:hypothetical protein [Sphingobacterium chuzhouense]|uniref:Uncharacterized protein n=1 Tax=Sphingobacterium chuzhouense TaxID=1742264 RepID=A0ABR7XR47_9SPHI|nr:hypothetical protein [Sphingobacterium chuzhouense]MBD1421625.1 hypothetical protein [Sphingobacterium chuzhouense]